MRNSTLIKLHNYYYKKLCNEKQTLKFYAGLRRIESVVVLIAYTFGAKAARTPNAILLDASEKERLLELRYMLILLSNI